MNKSISFITFIFGGIIGSAITWNYVKKKYEEFAQEEIESVKEAFKQSTGKEKEEHNKSVEKNVHKNLVEKLEYDNKHVIPKEDIGSFPHPYVIKPEEFGEFENYEKISLTYYSDGVLADDMDEVVDDIEETVGADSLDHFGEYEQDSVFVRNDILKTDFEILADLGKYPNKKKFSSTEE